MDMDSMGLNSGGNANKDKLPGQVEYQIKTGIFGDKTLIDKLMHICNDD